MLTTSQGDRTLTGAEAAAFRDGLGGLADMLNDADQDGYDVGIAVFDRMSVPQRLYLLATVGRTLLIDVAPPLELTSASEATVAAVFAMLMVAVDFEMDIEKHTPAGPVAAADLWATRKLIAAALVERRKDQSDRDATDLDEQHILANTDREDWMDLIDELADEILWDRDFESPIETMLAAETVDSNADRQILGLGPRIL